MHVEHVMGTMVSFHLRLESATARPAAESALRQACEELHDADALFSTWKADSPMNRVRRGLLPQADAPAEVAEVLDLCAYVRELSGGWFDPWAMPGGVDPTGLVKGWAAEGALRALTIPQVLAASVNAGGDVAVLGRVESTRPWRIGVRHPWRQGGLACVLTVEQAVATSGDYERGCHLVDPQAGRPATRAVSATVSGPSLAIADGLATALAVGADDVLAHIAALSDYEGYVVRADGTEAWTDGMPFSE